VLLSGVLKVMSVLSCTGTGNQPPGACLTFDVSMPRNLGIDGPVRSMSSMPTECPLNESVRASCVVTLDFPTPPLPESTRMISLTSAKDILSGLEYEQSIVCLKLSCVSSSLSDAREKLEERDCDYQFGGDDGGVSRKLGVFHSPHSLFRSIALQ
jgi:hypothetical protein